MTNEIRVKMPMNNTSEAEAWRTERDAIVGLASRFGTVDVQSHRSDDLILVVEPYFEQPLYTPVEAVELALIATGRELWSDPATGFDPA